MNPKVMGTENLCYEPKMKNWNFICALSANSVCAYVARSTDFLFLCFPIAFVLSLLNIKTKADV